MSQWYGILRQHFASLHYSLDIFGCPFGTRDCLSALPSTSWWEEDTERHWIKCFFCSFSTQILLHAHDVTSHGLMCITWSDVWHLSEEEAGCFTASITSEKNPPTMPWPSAALSRTQTRRELTGRRSCSPTALRDVKGISMNSQAVRYDVTVKCNQTPAKDTHTHKRMHTNACTHAHSTNQPFTRESPRAGKEINKDRTYLIWWNRGILHWRYPAVFSCWWHHHATNIRSARCCVDEMARNRQREELNAWEGILCCGQWPRCNRRTSTPSGPPTLSYLNRVHHFVLRAAR